LAKAVFSSDTLPPGLSDRHRFLAWRELHNQYFGRTDLVPCEGPFEARMTFVQAQDVVLGRGKVTFQESAHGGSRTQSIDEGRIGLIMNTTARAFRMRQRGHDEVLQPGGTMLVSTVDAVRLSAQQTPVTWVMLALPHAAVLRAAPRFEDLVGMPLRTGGEALRMIAGYAGLIIDEGGVAHPLLDAHVAQTIIDLVGLATGAEKDGAALAEGRGLRAARLEAIARAIARGYADPQFSIAIVARRLRLSERYIQELLQSTGSGFSERVLELRLNHSVTLLARPEAANRKISDIAFASGFNDLSYFHRCFRRRFGVTPAAARTA
jgi:AraC-like DNA-binding protein